MLPTKEPSQGPWVPFEESPRRQMTSSDESQRSAEAIAAVPRQQKDHNDDQQDGPLILPVKSLDTGVINVRLSR